MPDYYDRLRETDVFEEQALYNGANQSIDQNGTPMRVRVTRATPSFFRLLRVGPALGRTFGEADGEVGNDKKVVLSYALWQSQFGGDPRPIGKELRIDGQPFTVVGVMPKGFYFLNPERDAVAAARVHARSRRATSSGTATTFRTSAGSSRARRIERAQQQIDALNARNLEKFPRAEAAADQRRLPHDRRSAAGHAGARRQADAVSDVGRRAVRAADRLRQRRQPRRSCDRARG